MKKLLLTAAAVMGLMAPGLSHAAATTAECTGVVAAEATTGGCSAQFELQGPAGLQLIGTHANYHAPLATGAIVLQWIDASGRTVAEYECNAVGTAGVNDVTAVTSLCFPSSQPSTTYTPGTQTINVTVADGDAGEFHGQLQFGEPDLDLP